MKIQADGPNIKISHCDYFDLAQTFESGQCFRFERGEDRLYRGVALGELIVAGQENNTITFYNMTQESFDSKWKRYFDLDLDYKKVLEGFAFDPRLKMITRQIHGLRILKQDPWEALCSFIISQNNNIPRIKKIIDTLCRLFGNEIQDNYYSFPSAERVLEVGLEGLGDIRSGFRAKYIIDAAKKVSSQTIELGELQNMDYPMAKEALMEIKGVGDKVSDCVLLYGLGFYESFPKDVWVKRVIKDYYGEGFEDTYFGEYAGIAQQYLFYYERSLASQDK